MTKKSFCKNMIYSEYAGKKIRCFVMLDENGLCPNCDAVQRWHNRNK